MVSVLNYYDIKKVEYATNDIKLKDFIVIFLENSNNNNPPYFLLDGKTGFYSDLKHDITLSRDRLRSFKHTINVFIQTQQNNAIYEPTLPVPKQPDSPYLYLPFGDLDLGGGKRRFFFPKPHQT
jgi:hypothetical protein